MAGMSDDGSRIAAENASAFFAAPEPPHEATVVNTTAVKPMVALLLTRRNTANPPLMETVMTPELAVV
ncbi:hypothetical protein GCM10023075_71440 [Streptosporangium album]